MDFFCVTVPNYCVGVGCRCFVFVPLLFTMFPTIDQVTATVPGGVYWCFLLSFIVVVLIMIMIMIISIAFFFLFLFLSPYKLLFVLALLSFYMSVAEFIFDCIFCCYFCSPIFLVGTFVWLFGCCLSIGCWLLVVVWCVLSLFIVVVFYELHQVCDLFQFWYGISICCCGS